MTIPRIFRQAIVTGLAVLGLVSTGLAATVLSASSASAQIAGPYAQATVFRPDGDLASSPAVVTLPDIGTATFVLGTDDTIWWSTPSKNWASLGLPTKSTEMIPQGIIGAPAVVSWGPGRIDVFVESQANQLWQDFTTDSGASWSGWIQPVPDGTLSSPPAVTSSGPGQISVLVAGTDGNLWLRSWNFTTWTSGWLDIGSPSVAAGALKAAPTAACDNTTPCYYPPTVTAFVPGRLDVFIRGTDNALWQTFFVNNTWQGWFQPPGTQAGVLNSSPTADWWDADGGPNLTVFVQGTDAHLYQTTYDTAANAWTAWTVQGTQANVFQGIPETATNLQAEPIVMVWGTDTPSHAYIYLPG